MTELDPYLQTITDPNASDLDNALARVKYLESLIGQSDIEKALTEDNAVMAEKLTKLQEKLDFQKGKYRAQCLITEQGMADTNRLKDKAYELEKQVWKQSSELEKLGALLIKTQ